MDSRHTRRLRLSLSLSALMRLALEDLAERSGNPPTTQATLLLRQALHQTMQSDKVQQAYRSYRAQRGRDGWLADTMQEHAIETAYQQAQEHPPVEHSAPSAKALRERGRREARRQADTPGMAQERTEGD